MSPRPPGSRRWTKWLPRLSRCPHYIPSIYCIQPNSTLLQISPCRGGTAKRIVGRSLSSIRPGSGPCHRRARSRDHIAIDEHSHKATRDRGVRAFEQWSLQSLPCKYVPVGLPKHCRPLLRKYESTSVNQSRQRFWRNFAFSGLAKFRSTLYMVR